MLLEKSFVKMKIAFCPESTSQSYLGIVILSYTSLVVCGPLEL